MLEQAAAKTWGVDVADCQPRDHQVVNFKTLEKLEYGELVATAVELPVPTTEQLKLKPRDQWRYIGKPIRSSTWPTLPMAVRSTASTYGYRE